MTMGYRTRFVLFGFVIPLLVVSACTGSQEPVSEQVGSTSELTPEFASDLSPLRVAPGFAPVPFKASDDRIHLDYELYLANRKPTGVTVTRIKAVNAAEPSEVIVDLTGKELSVAMTSDLSRTSGDTKIPGAQNAIVYIDTSVAAESDVPADILHVIESKNSKTGEAHTSIQGAFTMPQDLNVPILAQPVSDGTWVAAEGCCALSHHRRPPLTLNGQDFLAQRYAVDFIKLVDGKLWEGDDPKDLNAWYTYGQDALAVVNGTVSSVLTNEDDITPFEPNPKPRNVDNITGNHVIIDIGNNQYVVYAHLQPNSIEVNVGDEVKVGQKLALVGNSGNTDAPHLHIHAMDANHVVQSHGIPFTFASYELLGSFDSIDTLLPEPFGEVGPDEPQLLPEPKTMKDAYPLELDIVRFSGQ